MPPQPRLSELGQIFWRAWLEGHESRPGDWSEKAISSAELEAWLRLEGIEDPVVRRDFKFVIRRVDREFLANRKEWSGEKAAEEKKKLEEEEAKRVGGRRR